MMRRSRSSGADRRRAVLVVVLFAAAAALDWLADARAPARVAHHHQAEIFSFIVAGIQALAGWLATAAEVTVTYLATAVSWLSARVANFLVSTGAVFARVWDGIKIVWADVLKPALVWIDKTVKTVYDWMRKTFKPVFDFLDDVRARIQKFYDHFVKPITDTIDFIRQLNALLRTFHIDILDELDQVLGEVRRYIDAPFKFVYAQLARIQNVIDRVVTFDGFFQRYMLVASLRKHAPLWMSHFWADQVGPVRGRDGSTERTADYPTRAAALERAELGAYFDTGAGARAGIIDELALGVMQTAENQAAAPAEAA
jgi:hypothetical protein